MYGNDYNDIGFSLKSIKNSMKKLKNKITGKKSKKKVIKPSLLTSDAQGGTQQRIPIGFPTVQFIQNGPTTLTTIVNPQKPFMPRRLIINEVLGGAAAGQTVLSGFTIATEDMLAGAGPIPVQAFAANATDMVLMTRASRPGIQISLRYDWIGTVLGVGDTVTVSSVLIGDAVSQ